MPKVHATSAELGDNSRGGVPNVLAHSTVRHLGVDPSFDGLRADPRFVRILERVGLAGVPGAVRR